MGSRRAKDIIVRIPEPSAEPGPHSRVAVQRCYDGLCRCGQPERYALEAAVAVYRWHHPGTSLRAAQDIVEQWVWNGACH